MSSTLPPTTASFSEEDTATLRDWNAQWTQILNGVQDQLASLGCTVKMNLFYKRPKGLDAISRVALTVTIPPPPVQ